METLTIQQLQLTRGQQKKKLAVLFIIISDTNKVKESM